MSGSAGLSRSETGAIGHVVREYLPRSETFVYTALRFQRGFEPVVYAKRTMNLEEFPLDEVKELVGPRSTGPQRVRRRATARLLRFADAYSAGIAECARKDRCLALHAHFGWSGLAALPAAERVGIPLITTFYGVDVSEAQPGRPMSEAYRRLFQKGSFFLCEGPAMAAHLSRQGCPADRIRIVPIGLDLGQWPFRPAQRTSPLVIAQASRFIDKKGIDLTLRAFAAARERLGPSELWLIGDGLLREDLETLAERLGITASVRFLGLVSYDEYREILRRVHVCLQPSRTAADGDTEGGAPTVLLEMQAVGIPVVSTRHADIPAVVSEPERLAPESDVAAIAAELVAVSQLSESEWQGRAERGRALIEAHHDATVVAGEIEAVYREALGVT